MPSFIAVVRNGRRSKERKWWNPSKKFKPYICHTYCKKSTCKRMFPSRCFSFIKRNIESGCKETSYWYSNGNSNVAIYLA